MTSTADAIEKQIVLRASRARVWRALADHREFGFWFGVEFDQPFAPGRRMNGILVTTQADSEIAKLQAPHKGMRFEITIEEMEPEQRFSFRWHPFAIEAGRDYSAEPTTLVTFVIEERQPGEVVLTLTESGFDQIPLERRAQAFTANEGGWQIMLGVLGGYVAGKS